MDQAPSNVCLRCEQELSANAIRCSCGALTHHASFKDRNEHEAEQWRAYQRASEHTGS